MVQKYNRDMERMNRVEIRQAKMLLNSSGRNALRGRQNKFGELGQSDGASKRVGENHKLAVQGGAGHCQGECGSNSPVNFEFDQVSADKQISESQEI